MSGRQLYGFQTPMKKNNMMLKANQCCTPTTPVHLKTMSDLKVVLEKIIIDPKSKKLINYKDIDAKGIKYFI